MILPEDGVNSDSAVSEGAGANLQRWHRGRQLVETRKLTDAERRRLGWMRLINVGSWILVANGFFYAFAKSLDASHLVAAAFACALGIGCNVVYQRAAQKQVLVFAAWERAGVRTGEVVVSPDPEMVISKSEKLAWPFPNFGYEPLLTAERGPTAHLTDAEREEMRQHIDRMGKRLKRNSRIIAVIFAIALLTLFLTGVGVLQGSALALCAATWGLFRESKQIREIRNRLEWELQQPVLDIDFAGRLRSEVLWWSDDKPAMWRTGYDHESLKDV